MSVEKTYTIAIATLLVITRKAPTTVPANWDFTETEESFAMVSKLVF